ncbi:MAG: GlsB/YeaQ/YmgE family stress response membrane protein [Planctomycetes bacterium]|nr:GlsB/YeaQ/YmgE family stress response membrane protein [Planctomycetota bacterium]
MSLLDFIVLLVIAGICGAIGQAIAGASRGGCLVAIAVGFIGAIVGLWLARLMNLPKLWTVSLGEGHDFPIVWSIIGAAIFMALINLISRPPRQP